MHIFSGLLWVSLVQSVSSEDFIFSKMT